MGGFGDWIADNAWIAWLGLAFALGIVETTTLDLVFLMLAGGALAGAGAAALGVSFWVQAVVAIVVSVALLGVVRPVAKRHMHHTTGARTGAAALVGRQAVVLENVDGENGLIKLGGEVWTARSYDGKTSIPAGKDVDVVEIKGATALVFEADST